MAGQRPHVGPHGDILPDRLGIAPAPAQVGRVGQQPACLQAQPCEALPGLDDQGLDLLVDLTREKPEMLIIMVTAYASLEVAISATRNGAFDFLAKPCLCFMNYIYRFIPNYGIAIIILTIVSRALFWPLAKKSYIVSWDMNR